MSDWEKIYRTNNRYRAEIIRAVLEDRGFSAVIIDKKDTSYHFGECEVYVPFLEADDAREVIETEIRFE